MADAPGMVAVVGHAVQGGIVVLGTVAEHTAAPIGQQLVGIVHLGHEFRSAASFFPFGHFGDLDDLALEHQQSIEKIFYGRFIQ